MAAGLGLGFLTAQLLARIEGRLVQVMTTLILVHGVFLLAEHLHVSGVIAVAVMLVTALLPALTVESYKAIIAR